MDAGRVAGPFKIPPKNLKVSPLGLVPKNNGGFRVIHNLSYSQNSDFPSVNEGIPHEACRVQYAEIQDAISLVRSAGRGCYMARSDIQNAFKIIPINPADYELQGFEWQGQFYFDKTLAMGCSLSCHIFEAFSTALQWILQNKFKIELVTHILDDFFFVHPSKRGCQALLDKFLWLCNDIGIPIAFKKTFGPDQVLPFEIGRAHV